MTERDLDYWMARADMSDKANKRLTTEVSELKAARLAKTLRELPDVKKAFDDVERLTADLADADHRVQFMSDQVDAKCEIIESLQGQNDRFEALAEKKLEALSAEVSRLKEFIASYPLTNNRPTDLAIERGAWVEKGKTLVEGSHNPTDDSRQERNDG